MHDRDVFDRRFTEALVRYGSEASTEVDPLDVARSVAAVRPRRSGPWTAFSIRRRAYRLLVIGGLTVLLVVAVLALAVVGSQVSRRDLAEAPVDVVSVGLGGWTELVAASDGTIWSAGWNGGVSLYDPSDGSVRVIGPWDDAVLARSRPLGAAAAGGIWLYDKKGSALVRARGSRVAETVPATDVCHVSDADELIVVTCAGAIQRWDGSAWRDATDPIPGLDSIDAFVTDPRSPGGYTVVNGSLGYGWPPTDTGRPTVWQRVAGAWTPHDFGPGPGFGIETLAIAPDGSIWGAGGDQMARHDGQQWQIVDASVERLDDGRPITVGPDGHVWSIGVRAPVNGGDGNEPAVAVRYDGASLSTLDIPIIADLKSGAGPTMLTTSTDVFASAWGALARLVDDRFVIIDPGPRKRLELIHSIAIDTRGRAWLLAGDDGIVRDDGTPVPVQLGQVVDGAYVEAASGQDAGTEGAELQEGPDRSVWMATRNGPQRLEGDRFEPVGPPLVVDTDISGRSGDHVLPPYVIGPDGTPNTVSRDRIVRLVGDTWEQLPPHPGAGNGTRELAISPDGEIWVATGHEPATVGLARYQDGRWVDVPLPERPSSQIAGVTGIAFDRDGTVWMRLVLEGSEGCDCRDLAVSRLRDGVWMVDTHVQGVPLGSVWTNRSGLPEAAYRDVLVDGDGIIWINGSNGIARYDAGVWTLAVEGMAFRHLTLGADGSIWAADPGVHRIAASTVDR